MWTTPSPEKSPYAAENGPFINVTPSQFGGERDFNVRGSLGRDPVFLICEAVNKDLKTTVHAAVI